MNWGGFRLRPGPHCCDQPARVATEAAGAARGFVGAAPGRFAALGFSRSSARPTACTVTPLLSPLGAPCTPPPWGTLMAVDLATGKCAGRSARHHARPRALAALAHLGRAAPGRPDVTASGLTFIGATTTAICARSTPRPARSSGGYDCPTAHATPMTYRLRPDGKQYVVLAAGGHGVIRTTPGDSLLAFALP